MQLTQLDTGVLLSGVTDFSLSDTLDCGQCFRWERTGETSFSGVAGTHCASISQNGDTLFFPGAQPWEVQDFWMDYLDLNLDYGAIRTALSEDPTLARAAQYAPGIRILRQESWEALCSFILSQNNNIARIKGIVRTLCAQFGQELPGGGYAFPSPQVLAPLTVEDLAPLRSGFRAKYILDAARKVRDGSVDFGRVSALHLPEARQELMQIHGVGPKVAECVLLYGFHRLDCFPVDVWIRRVMEQLFPAGLPDCATEYAGIAQQYLFHYARTSGELTDAVPQPV